MISITEYDLGVERVEFVGRAAFHRGLRADRHEDRRLDRAARRDEAAAAGLGGRVAGEEGEGVGCAVIHGPLQRVVGK